MTTARFAWILNLDAELELERPAFTASGKLKAQLALHGAGAAALLGPRDRLAEPGMTDASGFVGRAWCPTPRAVAELERAGVTPEPHPGAGVLRRVNHRRFACDLGLGLPGQEYAADRATLERLLRERERPLLLKRAFGFAGRGQRRVYAEGDAGLDDKGWAWVDASMARGGVVLEPFVEPLLEVSRHGFVACDGSATFGRVVVQTVSERGVFREARLARHDELRDDEARALDHAVVRVAGALRDAGYFGPFGIDAHRHRSRGHEGFCALSEINARFTMGFLTGMEVPPWELVLHRRDDGPLI